MIVMEIESEETVSSEEAKQILTARKKEKELVYEQRICDEFFEKTTRLTDAQLASMKEELNKIAILKDRYISLIISIMPDTEEEVEALFSKERTTLKKEEINQIVDIVKKHK